MFSGASHSVFFTNRNLRHEVSFLGFLVGFPTWIIYFCVLSLAVLHSYIPYTVIYGKAMENDGKLWKTYVLCGAGWIWNTREQRTCVFVLQQSRVLFLTSNVGLRVDSVGTEY